MNKEEVNKIISEIRNTNIAEPVRITRYDIETLINYIDILEGVINRIEKYLKDKNYHNLGYWVEDEEGGDVFIDVKQDILDIIKER